MQENDIILSVRNLTTSLLLNKQPIKVVDSLSFDMRVGKTVALVGESGSGKTLTALSILRILPDPPALHPEGNIFFKGIDLLKVPEKEMRKIRGNKIAMIFQDPMSALNPVLKIKEQLLEVIDTHLKLSDSQAFELAIKALEDVGLQNPAEIMNEYPHQLSGGMKQRVMIAMALLCSPDILIADEPTTALDVTVQAQILVLLKKLQQKRNMAILLITHDMGVVAEMADDVIVMYASQKVESGTVLDIFDRKSHPYTQGLFASRPETSIKHQKLSAIKGTVPPLNDLPSGCVFHPRCPYAMEKCKKEAPSFFSINSPQHLTQCWLYNDQEEN